MRRCWQSPGLCPFSGWYVHPVRPCLLTLFIHKETEAQMGFSYGSRSHSEKCKSHTRAHVHLGHHTPHPLQRVGAGSRGCVQSASPERAKPNLPKQRWEAGAGWSVRSPPALPSCLGLGPVTMMRRCTWPAFAAFLLKSPTLSLANNEGQGICPGSDWEILLHASKGPALGPELGIQPAALPGGGASQSSSHMQPLWSLIATALSILTGPSTPGCCPRCPLMSPAQGRMGDEAGPIRGSASSL